MQDGWKQDNAQPTPCEVIEVITGKKFTLILNQTFIKYFFK